MAEPEFGNERSRWEWLWIIRRVGDERARSVLAFAVQRGRRPFPLNAACELGLTLPSENLLPSLPLTDDRRADALRSIAGIRDMLRK